MIPVVWAIAAAASVVYAAILALNTAAAQTLAPAFIAVTCAAWLVLTVHHNWRSRR